MNFILMGEPLSLGQMQLGFVYLVFLPSILTTAFAGRLSAKIGLRTALIASFALAILGLPALLANSVTLVLAGLAMIAVGTFSAQAIATGFVSRTMIVDRGTASGIYLGCYFSGGLVGAAVLGKLFEAGGWSWCVGGIAVAFLLAAALSSRLRA